MIDKIKELIAEAEAFKAQTKEEVEAFRIKYLGKKGLLNEFFAEFKNVANDQKKEFGQTINTLKKTAEDKVKRFKSRVRKQRRSKRYFWRFITPRRAYSNWCTPSYFYSKKSNYRYFFRHWF